MIGDVYAYNSSLIEQEIKPVFTNKTYNYTDDQNTNYSTSQIKFDISSLYNQTKFVSAKEMVLVIPIVSVLSVSKGADKATKGLLPNNSYCMGFKSGYFNLVSSMQIVYDNQTIQQNCSNLNYLVNFNKLCSLSGEKQKKDQYTTSFIPDRFDSWEYNTSVSGAGNGLCNNDPCFVADDLKSKMRVNDFNKSYFKRMKKSGFVTEPFLMAESEIRSELKSYSVCDNDKYVMYDLAQIRLGDLSSFFDNLPLMKSFNCSITLDLNLGSLKMKYHPDLTVFNQGVLSLNAQDIDFRKGCCPLMVSPVGKGLNLQALTDVTEIVIGIHVVSVLSTKGSVSQNTLKIADHALTKCRIYVPMITMNEVLESKYLSELSKKRVFFNDFNYHTLFKVGAGSNINFSLSNTLSNLRGLLVIPFLSSEINGVYSTTTAIAKVVAAAGVVGVNGLDAISENKLGFSPVVSPFTSEPSNTSPLMKITDYNIQLGGENIYAQNLQYGFQQYQNEVSCLNALSGNQDSVVSSGLINQEMWMNNYRYYYTDLSRKLQDNQMKSVQIIGRNASVVPMDLHIYLIYSKEAIIDILTGKLLM